MNLEIDTIAEIAIAGIGGLAVVGFTILQLALRGMEKQHEITQRLIEEKFMWAETQRQDAGHHWNQQFSELKQSDQDMSRRISSLETRIITVELHLSQQLRQPTVSLSKSRPPIPDS